MAKAETDELLSRLEGSLTAISTAIVLARAELGEIRDGRQIDRARDELHEVVKGTEAATNSILAASEIVASLARKLVEETQEEIVRKDASAIHEQTQKIFEACNFQDLTGQRIAKIVRTIEFIEKQIGDGLRSLGASGATSHSRMPKLDRRTGEEALLNGPSLPGEASVSQSDVDEMFP